MTAAGGEAPVLVPNISVEIEGGRRESPCLSMHSAVSMPARTRRLRDVTVKSTTAIFSFKPFAPNSLSLEKHVVNSTAQFVSSAYSRYFEDESPVIICDIRVQLDSSSSLATVLPQQIRTQDSS